MIERNLDTLGEMGVIYLYGTQEKIKDFASL